MLFASEKSLRRQVSASTEAFEGQAKFDFWHEVCRSSIVGINCQPIDRGRFNGSAKGIMLDSTRVLNVSVAPHRAFRQPEALLDPDPAGVFVVFVTSGSMHIEQDGRQANIRQGDGVFGVVDRPFVATCNDWVSFSMVRLPRSMWMRGDRCEEALTARSLADVKGFGAMMYGFVSDFSRQVESLDNYAIDRLSHVCIDLLESCFDVMADDVDDDRASYKSATLLRVKQFIETNVESEKLSGHWVAAEMRLSHRYLNRLFESEGTSLVRYIWTRRLERAAKNLGNPRLRRSSISTIAHNLGFKNTSHFSYAFRGRFGLSPSDYRGQLHNDI